MLFFPPSRVQILKTDYKYGQYCTPLSQSHCRYFFLLAIINDTVNFSFSVMANKYIHAYICKYCYPCIEAVTFLKIFYQKLLVKAVVKSKRAYFLTEQ